MTVMMVQADVKAEHVEEVEAAVRTLFAAIEREQPPGVRYASTRTEGGEGDTFVILLQVEETPAGDAGQNPLGAIAEFREFQAALGGERRYQDRDEEAEQCGDATVAVAGPRCSDITG